MIRIEILFGSQSKFDRGKKKGHAMYENTLADAKAYVQSLIDNGVVVEKVAYFDKDTREADIAAGRVS